MRGSSHYYTIVSRFRQRIKKHFEDNVSPVKNHRAEIHKIEVYEIPDPMEREIYETYAINQFRAKYIILKVLFNTLTNFTRFTYE